MDYSFNAEIAKVYGVDAAVIIHNLYWWICKNIANEKHIYDGKAWTYNTIKAFSDLFPFFTERQIRTVLLNLKKQKAITVGNYNKTPMDRTQWYSLSDEIMAIYEKGKCKLPNGQMGNSQDEQSGNPGDKIYDKYNEFGEKNALGSTAEDAENEIEFSESEFSKNESNFDENDVFLGLETANLEQNSQKLAPILPKCQMQVTEQSNASDQTVKCICPNSQMHLSEVANVPYINTNNKLNINSINQSKTKNIINNSNITPLSPKIGEKGLIDRLNSCNFSDTLKAAVSRWLTYKQHGYDNLSLNALLEQVAKYSDEASEESVIVAIDESIANLYAGVVWDRLKRAQNQGKLAGFKTNLAEENERREETVISDKAAWFFGVLQDKIAEFKVRKDFFDDEYLAKVLDRFFALIEDVTHRRSIKINQYDTAIEKILESYVDFFRDSAATKLIKTYQVIDEYIAKGGIKNVFNYSVSTLYNSARLE